jgi:hypothetical protein
VSKIDADLTLNLLRYSGDNTDVRVVHSAPVKKSTPPVQVSSKLFGGVSAIQHFASF